MFMTSLWIQKVNLRIQNILTFYTKQQVVKGEAVEGNNVLDNYPRFLVENTELPGGDKGTLGITVVPDQNSIPPQTELDKHESEYKQENKGEKYQEIVMTSDYLDDWRYDIKVTSKSIYNEDSSYTKANMQEKLQVMTTLFPEIFQLNKDKIFKQTMIAYEDDPDEYMTVPPKVQAPVMMGANGEPSAATQAVPPTTTAGPPPGSKAINQPTPITKPSPVI